MGAQEQQQQQSQERRQCPVLTSKLTEREEGQAEIDRSAQIPRSSPQSTDEREVSRSGARQIKNIPLRPIQQQQQQQRQHQQLEQGDIATRPPMSPHANDLDLELPFWSVQYYINKLQTLFDQLEREFGRSSASDPLERSPAGVR